MNIIEPFVTPSISLDLVQIIRYLKLYFLFSIQIDLWIQLLSVNRRIG